MSTYAFLVDTPPNSPTPDYQIQPSSDFGSLGPGSDVKLGTANASGSGDAAAAQPPFGVELKKAPSGPPPSSQSLQTIRLAAILSGVVLAIAAIIAQKVGNNSQAFNNSRHAGVSRNYDPAAQKQAEQLLTRVAQNDANAVAQVDALAPTWRGRVHLTPQLTSLVTAGLNARDLNSRAATIRTDLAAMGVAEDSRSVDKLASQAESSDHATRIWAIWTLGLVANRGVETDHIVAVLTAHLSDNDVESRHWAAEALSYTGSDASVAPLVKAMHDDPSPLVRERAACGLAESGMLTSEQRRTAVPTLLLYVDDASLDSATRGWTYHALRDITGQRLPDDSAAWRRWYESTR